MKLCNLINRLHIYARGLRLRMPRINLLAYFQRQWQLLVLLILYVFYHRICEYRLAPLLVSFEPSIGSRVVWLCIVAIALVYTYTLSRRRYVLSEGMRSWTVVVFVGWAYYRFRGAEDSLAPLPLVSGVYYIDLFLVLCACVLFVACWSHWMRKKAKKVRAHEGGKGYDVESPCSSRDEDLLGRREEAKALARKLFQTDTSRGAFTLGLTAPWGAGKTSFLLTVKEHLKARYSKEVVLIDFNPWMYRKAPNLTPVFFEEFSRALAPYSSALASGFISYLNNILAKESNAWLWLGLRLLPQGFNVKSTSGQYKFLSQEIRHMGRKIFIFIDDVDRLESEEIVELFGLVRNSSSFPHITYFLAYDKEYVSSQLQSKFGQHTHRYMEKILQEEYALAQITPEQLEVALAIELERIGNTTLLRDIKKSGINLVHHLLTLRVIKRICNTLSSFRKDLEGNVALFDWFVIELIRTQYPRLFDFLRENHSRAFELRGDKRLIKMSELREEKETWIKLALSDHPKYGGGVDFSKYLSVHQDSLQIKNIGLVIELLMAVWGEMRPVAPLQANHADYLERYFYGTLRVIEIDEVEFREHMKLSFKEIKPYLRVKMAGQFADLLRKIRREPIEGKETATKIIQILFYLLSDFSKEFDIHEISDKISSLNECLQEDQQEDQLKRELINVFNQEDTIVGVLRYLSAVTNREYAIEIPFTQEELDVIKEDRFMSYHNTLFGAPHAGSEVIDCYRLWILCQSSIKVDLGGRRMRQKHALSCHPSMDKVMRQRIEENIELLIPCFIQQCDSEGIYYDLLVPEPIRIWSQDGGKEKYFPNFLLGLKGVSSPVMNECQKFIRKWLKRGRVPIPFSFKYIVPLNIRLKEVW